jgi:hypothetical protein
LDIEHRADSIACEQSRGPLATFLGQFLLNLFPTIKFTGVRQINCPSIYFESSPAHHTPLYNRWLGIVAAAVDEIASLRHTACRQMFGECQKSTWQFSGNVFVDQIFPLCNFNFEGLNFECNGLVPFFSACRPRESNLKLFVSRRTASQRANFRAWQTAHAARASNEPDACCWSFLKAALTRVTPSMNEARAACGKS